ncbi:MAG: preprotein translocase subunit SecY [Chthoniobacteraceae bacterium]
MISAFFNIRKIPELRNRVLFTLLMVVLYRIGCAITCPGVNASVLKHYFIERVSDAAGGGGAAALLNIFSGGALEQCAVFSLGVMPYISASIMMQLLTAVVPQLGKLAKEDGGRQKITQYTRYVTIVLCLFQGWLMTRQFVNPSDAILPGIRDTMSRFGPLVPQAGFWFEFNSVVTLTAGTMLLMWIGDQITDRGIGNGMSLIISVGIVARLPAALVQAWKTVVPSGAGAGNVAPMKLVLMLGFLILVIAGVICLTQAQRRITIQYAKRVVGRKVYGGVAQYMPLKVNYAGVMPIIFGQALLVFPATMVSMIAPESPGAQKFARALDSGWPHYVIYSLMIFFFSYFWVATQFQPQQIADDLKKAGGYLPGVRPGKPTAEYLDRAMTRLTFAGAIFLLIIALLPDFLSRSAGIPPLAAQFFGGTSILIVVGVVLDTMRQIETHLLQRHYDGFLRKGKLRGRFDRTPGQRGETVTNSALLWLAFGASVLILAGIVAFLMSRFGQ